MAIRIVLLADEALAKVSKEYSELLNKKLDCRFKLDQDHIPHVTVLHPEVKEDKLNELMELLYEAIRGFGEIRVKTTDVGNDGYKGWIGVYFESEKEILKLKEIIAKKAKRVFKSVSKSPRAHLTLTRLEKEGDDPKAFELCKDFPKREFVFRELAICEEGEDGTCKSVLTRYTL